MKKTASKKTASKKTTPRRAVAKAKAPLDLGYRHPPQLGDYAAGRHEVLVRVIEANVQDALSSYERCDRYRAAGDQKRALESNHEAANSVRNVIETFNIFCEVPDREQRAYSALQPGAAK